ncbi:hypothetical protein [Parageobacillus galactosidasius]|uniref:Uncharacterized protein n=1 Tax=Parageobacillus galactosidasius TaxID=883812 RepID=A0A226QQI2_9BACL|nr:hypothetical protein [Parageobacillus galactosidasius]OXB94731.1 hypothetical protein B9L23_07660 [Parageobacillus galactosidasius]
MAQTGVVKQLQEGLVFECSLAEQCKALHNGQLPAKKNCLLSVDHGDRCRAWDNQHFTWLIHKDPNLIEQL